MVKNPFSEEKFGFALAMFREKDILLGFKNYQE